MRVLDLEDDLWTATESSDREVPTANPHHRPLFGPGFQNNNFQFEIVTTNQSAGLVTTPTCCPVKFSPGNEGSVSTLHPSNPARWHQEVEKVGRQTDRWTERNEWRGERCSCEARFCFTSWRLIIEDELGANSCIIHICAEKRLEMALCKRQWHIFTHVR